MLCEVVRAEALMLWRPAQMVPVVLAVLFVLPPTWDRYLGRYPGRENYTSCPRPYSL